eukprot:m.102048 g.102048  ORF g.102048 m.102048 type:complete len:276 (-) comp15677_c2_seq2:194-1021(-)
MELPDIGAPCSFGDCAALDFLPCTCHWCNAVFCRDHVFVDKHACPTPGVAPSADVPDDVKTSSATCSVPGCQARGTSLTTCVACKKDVCFTHRYPLDHNCPNAAVEEAHRKAQAAARAAAQASAAAAIDGVRARLKEATSSLTTPQSKRTALKVRLMKIKLKAVGEASVPIDRRVYFEVVHVTSTAARPGPASIKPLFFDGAMSSGQLLDKVAAAFKLVNNNHDPSKPALRLVRAEDGACVDFASPVSEQVPSGSQLVLTTLIDMPTSFLDSLSK